MGWLQLRRAHDMRELGGEPTKHQDIADEHIEIVHTTTARSQRYPVVPEDIPDNKLPLIPASEVTDNDSRADGLWIVVDNIVYDCTEFVVEHPGGSTVIESFNGKDCSWQFWRFHTQKHMMEFGRALRIGRCKGVNNPFKEPPRYFGLRKLGNADEDW